MASIYQINKGINKPIMFKGLKAQYIAYLAIGIVALFIAFAVLYILGLSLFIVLPLISSLGIGLFFTVFRLSHQFGEHGLIKYFARKSLPKYIRFQSRGLFIRLKNQSPISLLESQISKHG